MQDPDIDLSDIPEVTEEQMARAKLRIGGKSVPRALIIQALKDEIRKHDLETIVRRAVREELSAYKVSRESKRKAISDK